MLSSVQFRLGRVNNPALRHNSRGFSISNLGFDPKLFSETSDPSKIESVREKAESSLNMFKEQSTFSKDAPYGARYPWKKRDEIKARTELKGVRDVLAGQFEIHKNMDKVAMQYMRDEIDPLYANVSKVEMPVTPTPATVPVNYCIFCYHGTHFLNPYNTTLLSRFVTERGFIMPRRMTKACNRHQRQLASSIRRARWLYLMPYHSKLHPRLRVTGLNPAGSFTDYYNSLLAEGKPISNSLRERFYLEQHLVDSKKAKEPLNVAIPNPPNSIPSYYRTLKVGDKMNLDGSFTPAEIHGKEAASIQFSQDAVNKPFKFKTRIFDLDETLQNIPGDRRDDYLRALRRSADLESNRKSGHVYDPNAAVDIIRKYRDSLVLDGARAINNREIYGRQFVREKVAKDWKESGLSREDALKMIESGIVSPVANVHYNLREQMSAIRPEVPVPLKKNIFKESRNIIKLPSDVDITESDRELANFQAAEAYLGKLVADRGMSKVSTTMFTTEEQRVIAGRARELVEKYNARLPKK